MKYCLLLVLFLASGQAQAAADVFTQHLFRSTSIRLRYFNPYVTGRSVANVGDVNGEHADFDFRINCPQHVFCGELLKTIPRLLAAAMPLKEPCISPPYARLDFFEGGQREIEAAALFDFSGSCVSFQGKSYRLQDDFIMTLQETPLRDW